MQTHDRWGTESQRFDKGNGVHAAVLGLTVSHVPVATLILSSPPNLNARASSAISRSSSNRRNGVAVLSSSKQSSSVSLPVMTDKDPERTASSSLRSEMDRVKLGGKASTQSPNERQTGE